MENKPYLVGITGGSASGKTAFIENLRHHFLPQELCLISQDNYYKSTEEQPRDAEGQINYDLPECIDVDRFAKDLNTLHEGEQVLQQEYLFQVEHGKPKEIRLLPAPILVVEGLFIFHFHEIFDQLDLRVFIEADDHIKLNRRIQRDTKERGVPESQVYYQWDNHVKPAYEKYLLPYKDSADIIVNNNKHFLTSLEVIKNHFHQILHS